MESIDTLLTQTPACIFIASPSGALLRWSEALERLMGRPLTQEMTVVDLVMADDREIARAAWNSLNEGGAVLSFECRIRFEDRSVRSCLVNARRPPGRAEVHGVLQPQSETQERERRVLRGIVENLEIIVWSVNRDGVFTSQEGHGLKKAGLTSGQFVGQNVFELYASNPDGVAGVRRGLSGERVHYNTTSNGVSWEHWLVPSPDCDEATALMGVTLDITEKTRAERELTARLALIEEQREAIQAMSTPIIQVWDSVLTVPLLGVIDAARAAALMEDLLSEVARTKARYAILDLTGVESIDTTTAGHLIDIIRALQLLGAAGIITGIRPSIAQTMVGLGLDMTCVVTRANLRAGLELCMQRMGETSDRSR